MAKSSPLRTHDHAAGGLQATLGFLKQTRYDLRELRKVRVFRDRVQFFDVNGDCCEVCGLGYADADVVPVLDALNAAYKRETIHAATDEQYKEFSTGRRYTWAADRVM